MSANPYAQFRQLQQRPDIDQIIQQYVTMSATIRQRLSAEIGLPDWQEKPDGGSSSGCGHEFSGVKSDQAITRGLPLWGVERNIPDEKWQRTVQIVTDIASQYGFDAPVVLVDKPGRHSISLQDKYGGEISFGTRVHTSILILTGCHLTAEAHARGKPDDSPSNR